MTTEELQKTLKRMAKFGSCIPEDVADLRAHISALEQELADARKGLDAERESHAVTKNQWSLTRADCRDLTRERDELQTEVSLKQAALASAWRDHAEEREMRTRAEELANANADKANAAIADNAAVLEELKGLVTDMHTLMANLLKHGVQVSFTPDPRLQATLDQPHPGAALLEEHRKALVRARNEGLELVAKKFDSLGAGPLITSATLLAKNVRSMKEPEQ